MSGKNKAKQTKRKRYSAEDLENAVLAVKKGKTLRAAAESFNVPYATIHSRVKGIYPIKINIGPKTVFNDKEEQEIVDWILNMSKCGFPVTKDQLLDCVQNYVTKQDKSTPFTNNRPSKKWYKSFLTRHPELSIRIAQNLTKRRANITEQVIRGWFSEIKTYLSERNLLDIGSERVFNLDESAFCLSPKIDKVLVRRSEKAPYTIVGSDKEYYTALIGGNAAGNLIPTMVVYNNERISPQVSQSFPDDFVIGKSNTGWMTTETFYMYIVNHLYPWLVNNKIQFPVVIYVDGHGSHINLELSNFCHEKQIELICLYPNATHLMQPMDVALFRPLKNAYKEAVRAWRMEHNGEALTKVFFATVLKNALNSIDLSQIIGSGFKRCGLFPFSANEVNYKRLITVSEASVSQSHDVTEVLDHTPVPPDQVDFPETRLDPATLRAFLNVPTPGQWTGPTEFKALYDFWYACKKEKTNQIGQNQSKDSNSVEDSLNITEHRSVTAFDQDVAQDSSDREEEMKRGIIIRQQDFADTEVLITECPIDQSSLVGTSINDEVIDNNISADELHALNIILVENFSDESSLEITQNISTNNDLDENKVKLTNCSKTVDESLHENHIHSPSSLVDSLIEETNTQSILSKTSPNNTSFRTASDENHEKLRDMKDASVSTDNPRENPVKDVINKQTTIAFKVANSDLKSDDIKINLVASKKVFNKSELEDDSKEVERSSGDKGSSTESVENEASSSKLSSVQSSFKDYAYYPELLKNKKANSGKRKYKEKLPFAATGLEWRTWHENKAKEKEEEEKRKADSQEQKIQNLQAKKEYLDNLQKIKLEKNEMQAKLKDIELNLQRCKATLRLLKIKIKNETMHEEQMTLKKQMTELEKEIDRDSLYKQDFTKLIKNLNVKQKEFKNMINSLKIVRKIKVEPKLEEKEI